MARSQQQQSSSEDNPFGVIARGAFEISSRKELSGLVRESREALGLSADAPVVMSGHQAELWHPGILAKRFAAVAIAKLHHAQSAWVVVDTDTNSGGSVVYPSRESDGNPGKRHWDWLGRGDNAENVPLCCVPSGQAATLPSTEDVWNLAFFERLERMQRVLTRQHAEGRTAAVQLTSAADTLLKDIEQGTLQNVSMASTICRTPIFDRLWRVMVDDPAACVGAYNAAAAKFRGSGIRELSTSGEAFELPVWQIEKNRRRAVRVRGCEDALQVNVRSLAPRALFLTATMRLALCDVFIHGLGGEMYDRVMEAWLKEWLPRVNDVELRSLVLAPSIAVTATMRLGFEGVRVPTPEEIARQVWAAHHARHNPGWARRATTVFGAASETRRAVAGEVGSDWEVQKRDILDAMIAAKQRGDDPLPHYRRLHNLLEASRVQLASVLAWLEKESGHAAAAKRLANIVHDRTWSFALHDNAALVRLREDVERRIRSAYS